MAAAFFFPYFTLYLAFNAVYIHYLIGVEDLGILANVFLLQLNDTGVDVEAFGYHVAGIVGRCGFIAAWVFA